MKHFTRLLAIAVFVSLACWENIYSKDIKFKVFRDGRKAGSVKMLKKSGCFYMNLSDLGSIYRTVPRYYPVSKKAVIGFSNNTVELFYDSDSVIINNTLKVMDKPSLTKKSKIYVPASLITANSFSEVSRYNAEFEFKEKILNLKRRISLRKPEVLSFMDLTRIIINFDSTISYKVVCEDPGKIIYEFENGFCGKNQDYAFNDGILNMIKVNNHGRDARMTVYLDAGAGGRQEFHYKKENYLVIDFERTPLAKSKEKVTEKNAPPSMEYIVSLHAKNISQDVKDSKDVPDKKAERAIEAEKVSDSLDSESDPGAGKESADEYSADSFAAGAILEKLSEAGEKIKTGSQELIKAIKKEAKENDGGPVVVVIDAGHGGEDPGAIGYSGAREKKINLTVAKMISKRLKKDGFKVLMTRNDDTFVPLMKRTEFANKVNADLFVSVHCNSSLKRNTRGFEVFYLSQAASDSAAEATARLENAVMALEGHDKKRKRDVQELLFSMAINRFMNESSEMSAFVKEQVMKKVKMKKYAVKQAGFHVLKGAQMPAVLIECGYLSNKWEEKLLCKSGFQEKFAEGVAEGIKIYAKKKFKDKKQ